MNRLDTMYNGGAPYVLNDLRFMQSALAEGIAGLASFYSITGDPVIISGLIGTVAGSITSYTAGFVAINGEVYYVPGAALFTAAAFKGIDIAPTTDTEGQKMYEDGTSMATFIVRRGELTSVASGTTIDLVDLRSNKEVLAAQGAMVSIETAWVEVGSAGAPAFSAGWANQFPGTPGSRVRYRRNKIGDIEITGIANNANMTLAQRTVFTLPAGFRPIYGRYYILHGDDGMGNFFNQAVVAVNGEVQLYGDLNVPKSVAFDPVRFATT